MTPLTPETIAEIRARVEAAMPEVGKVNGEIAMRVLTFDLPRLLSAYEELQAENERLQPLLYALERDEAHGNLRGRAEDAWYKYRRAEDSP